MLSLIAAVAQNNIIGNQGKIPWNLPQDMALFKKATMHHSVIMGRKTFESIGTMLPGRRMIVLSRTLPAVSSANLVICRTIAEAIEEIQGQKTAFVIGGEQIYAQMMPFADEMFISHLDKAYEGDSWFPNIDTNIWNVREQEEFPGFTHSRYIRI